MVIIVVRRTKEEGLKSSQGREEKSSLRGRHSVVGCRPRKRNIRIRGREMRRRVFPVTPETFEINARWRKRAVHIKGKGRVHPG